ncbi:FtsX-like permease family protein [Enterococcus sp. CSURQ0835]|uniref:FtsX-like permease family protein n=1 Tax=Enterococcus sp. CSURQ0835 TaxID=2681394 RepID=UPI00135680A6|nr:ABC transporter permease [Enterococcus sp. CSURQ0835]
MLAKIAWRGFKKHAQNYLFYFFSMVFAVMVYYSFTAMTYEQPLIRGAGQSTRLVSTLATGSITVVLILLFFMTSMSRFFLESRQKDIAIFRLNGWKLFQVASLFLFELLILGSSAFVAGIVLGILTSKLFSMILVKAMGLPLQVDFFLSFDAIAGTALVMGFILLVVSLQMIWQIAGYKVTQLKERPVMRTRKLVTWQKVVAIFGGIVLLSGWVLALNYLKLVKQLTKTTSLLQANFIAMLVIFSLCVIGTYLFFAQTLRYYASQKNPLTYRNLRLLSRSDFQLRLGSEWNFLGTVTIFLGLALAILGGVAAMVSIQMNGVNEAAPVTLMMDQGAYQTFAPQLKGIAVTKQTLTFKVIPAKQKMSITGEGSDDEPGVIDLIALPEYQKFQALNPYLPELKLKSSDSAVLLTPFQTILRHYVHYAKKIQLQNQTLQLQSLESNYLGDRTLRYGENMLVVSAEVFDQTNGQDYHLTALNVPVNQEEKVVRKLHQTIKSNWIAPIHADLKWQNHKLHGTVQKGEAKDKQIVTTYRTNYIARLDTYRQTRHRAGLLLFIVTFVAMTFIITTASTVSMRQISEAERKKGQYELLYRLGIPEKNIDQLIYRENRSIFFPPAILGIIHSVFAIRVFTQIVQNANYWFVYLFCGILIAVYGSFYWLTCLYQKKIVQK